MRTTPKMAMTACQRICVVKGGIRLLPAVYLGRRPCRALLSLDDHRGEGEDEEEDHEDYGEVEQRPLCTAARLVYAGVAAAENPTQTAALDLKENGYDETDRDDDLHNLQVEKHFSTSKL
jgi:hypothetical protein